MKSQKESIGVGVGAFRSLSEKFLKTTVFGGTPVFAFLKIYLVASKALQPATLLHRTRHVTTPIQQLGWVIMRCHLIDSTKRCVIFCNENSSWAHSKLICIHSIASVTSCLKCLLKSILLRLQISTCSSSFGMRLVRLTRLHSSPLLIKPELSLLWVRLLSPGCMVRMRLWHVLSKSRNKRWIVYTNTEALSKRQLFCLFLL